MNNEEKDEDTTCSGCGIRQYNDICPNCGIKIKNKEEREKTKDDDDDYDYRERR